MNPSSSGWIDKFGQLSKENSFSVIPYNRLYNELKEAGFIYGINVGTPSLFEHEHELSEDEKAKINLLTSLYFTYISVKDDANFENFVDATFEFYTKLDLTNISFFNKILTGKKTSSQLEKLIDSRIHLEDNAIKKAFSNSITNSLLFVDVFAFKSHLKGDNPITRAQLLEYITINIALHALGSKEKNKHDESLKHLLASSITYINIDALDFDGSYRNLLPDNFSLSEKKYFLDIACLTIWEDQSFEYKESEFIFGIGSDLGFNKETINIHLETITLFFEKNAKNISHLQNKNLVNQVYDGMSKVVRKLILRNSKRLHKELIESKELVSLLSKATLKDLNSEEKKKVQKQLLDIFKSVPSLAIFLLPGGAILLPIFIRLVPKLLPSAFDDNRIED